MAGNSAVSVTCDGRVAGCRTSGKIKLHLNKTELGCPSVRRNMCGPALNDLSEQFGILRN